MIRTVIVAAFVASAAFAASASPAIAQTPDDKARAEAVYADGQQRYAAGNWAAAADRFKAAYDIDPDPAYLFNIAQALREAKKCADSARYYHRFLDQVASAPNLDKVHGYLDEVEACARAQKPPPGQPLHDAPSASVLRPAGIGVGVAGIVLLGIGAGYAWHVSSLETEREGLCPSGCVWADVAARANNLQSHGDRSSTIAIVSTSVGVAALATGVMMYWLGGRAEHVGVAPHIGGAVITTTVRF